MKGEGNCERYQKGEVKWPRSSRAGPGDSQASPQLAKQRETVGKGLGEGEDMPAVASRSHLSGASVPTGLRQSVQNSATFWQDSTQSAK